MKKLTERLFNGIIKENPTFVLMLGMCATLAVTTEAINGLGMGLSTMVVLVLSNLMISLLRKIIPDGVRMPAYIVIIASFVTIVQLVIEAYVPSLYEALGIFIPLIVVNCIILGRAEAYASKNGALLSMFDGIGMGLGFTGALTILGLVREFFGAGTAFGVQVLPESVPVIPILVQAPGAFFVLALLTALQNKLKAPSATNVNGGSELACGGHCAGCHGCDGVTNHLKVAEQTAEKARLLAEEKKRRAEEAKKAAAEKAAKTAEGGDEA
ncbi:MAG: electron transport complex subunit E [Ruminococcaceae bacterium]|nr:electron transport complex subunit E [Oscillospiraceae bacterium]